MTIFSKNIVKEYSVTWVVIFAGLLMIVFVTQLVRYFGYAANGSVPFGSVFLLFTLGSIKNLPILFSLSIVLSVTLSLSRWYRDSEMVVWASSGKALSAWVMPTLGFVTPIALLVTVLTLFLAPWAEQRLEIEKQTLEVNDDISTVSPGIFIESKDGSTVFFVDSLESSVQGLKGVFIFNRDANRISITSANRGRQEESAQGASYLVVEDGYRYTEFKQSLEFDATKFATYGVRMDKNPVSKPYVHLGGRSTISLIEEGSPQSFSELVWRIGLPLSAILLALISIPISFVNNRGGRSYSVAVGVLFFLFYKNVLGIVQAQVYQSSWSLWMGLTLPHLIILVIFILLLLLRVGAFKRGLPARKFI
ncbi:LPS export ABC transporter permease LptF [Burkholderiales bacterium]|nr:LPS export ABC transporter permease LptF [Burkholderiales bacterium]